MKRAAAILTNRGGRTSHAAIVSRELGVPCVVGADGATTTLKEGQIITVDGTHGKVYDGAIEVVDKNAEREAEMEALNTKTRVYVNLAQPDRAEEVAKRHVDGIGLLPYIILLIISLRNDRRECVPGHVPMQSLL